LKFVTRFTPVALHFGSLESRLLQLTGGPSGWNVHIAKKATGEGSTRHGKAASGLAQGLKNRIMGKDVCMATTTEAAALSVVPVETAQLERLQSTLEEAAARSLDDSEGISYRFLPLADSSASSHDRSEFLLLCLGQSELRRCSSAGEALGLRPVGLEISAFPVARALILANQDVAGAWGFLHIGLDHAFFGIALDGEIRFLKSMEHSGSSLLNAMYEGADIPLQMGLSGAMASSFLTEPENEETTRQADDAHAKIQELQSLAEEQGTRLMSSLRLEAANLAQEVRACLRHFHARNQGNSVTSLELTGIAAGLPGLHTLLEQSLKIHTEVARPFTKLGIGAPAAMLREQHLWCANLGLALRGAA
jgi:Tfp pilus assembly PilM family ATPase